MGNRVKKVVVASGFGIGMLPATATPALADPWGISANDCWWGGGRVVQVTDPSYGAYYACSGGALHGELVSAWR
jgi:hypothetical protein